MPLKEFLVDGDVLDGDHPAPGVVLGNGVDEERGIPVAQAVQDLRDVNRHSTTAYQLSRLKSQRSGLEPQGSFSVETSDSSHSICVLSLGRSRVSRVET